MTSRLVLIVLFALTLAACGVKSDLIQPNGQPTPKDDQDPSRPPQPIGR